MDYRAKLMCFDTPYFRSALKMLLFYNNSRRTNVTAFLNVL